MRADRSKQALEDIKIKFLEDWDAGLAPTLDVLVRQHPAYASDLSRFVLQVLELKRSPIPADDSFEPSARESQAFERGLEAAMSGAEVLIQRLREIDKTTAAFATAMNLPNEIGLMLAKNGLTELPAKLTERAARFLEVSRGKAAQLLAPRPQMPQAAYLLRAKTGSTGFTPTMRTFREALLLCKQNGHLTPDQEAEWSEVH